jgi:uncharacterized protein Yka (UPF0111/DUF47 family)
MLKRLLPRQNGFFDLFQKTADLLVLTATQFHIMLLDLNNQQQYVDAIAAFEEEADQVTHSTFELLHKTFITPFDRNDIHLLTSQLDDVIDRINRCAQYFPIYQLTTVPSEVIDLAELAVQSTKLLKKAVYRLNNLKKSSEILGFCEDLSFLESDAHTLVLAGEKALFAEEHDFKHFIKLQEIYANTKSVINRSQDVAHK